MAELNSSKTTRNYKEMFLALQFILTPQNEFLPTRCVQDAYPRRNAEGNPPDVTKLSPLLQLFA